MHGFKYIASLLLVGVGTSILTGGICAYIFSIQREDTERLVKEFYITENAVHVNPHDIRQALDAGKEDFVLVDLRSSEEYVDEHIVGAINIPVHKDRNSPFSLEADQILGQFQDLILEYPGKDIIVYCYNMPCMSGRAVGLFLAEHDIYVKQLGIGWNEWRYYWTLWNHEHEWGKTYSEDYIARGVDPGKLREKETPSP